MQVAALQQACREQEGEGERSGEVDDANEVPAL